MFVKACCTNVFTYSTVVAHSFLEANNSFVDIAISFLDKVNSSLNVFYFGILQVLLSNWDRVWILSPSPVDPESKRANVRCVLVALKGVELLWSSVSFDGVHTYSHQLVLWVGKLL